MPYNPEQNGVAERKNKTIVEAISAMLYDQDMPKFLWAEACNTTIYLKNRSPHIILGMITPEESFFGRKPNVYHFRIFRDIVYYHFYKDRRNKLEPTTKMGVFV